MLHFSHNANCIKARHWRAFRVFGGWEMLNTKQQVERLAHAKSLNATRLSLI